VDNKNRYAEQRLCSSGWLVIIVGSPEGGHPTAKATVPCAQRSTRNVCILEPGPKPEVGASQAPAADIGDPHLGLGCHVHQIYAKVHMCSPGRRTAQRIG
jgi:hypothetical protein